MWPPIWLSSGVRRCRMISVPRYSRPATYQYAVDGTPQRVRTPRRSRTWAAKSSAARSSQSSGVPLSRLFSRSPGQVGSPDPGRRPEQARRPGQTRKRVRRRGIKTITHLASVRYEECAAALIFWGKKTHFVSVAFRAIHVIVLGVAVHSRPRRWSVVVMRRSRWAVLVLTAIALVLGLAAPALAGQAGSGGAAGSAGSGGCGSSGTVTTVNGTLPDGAT